MCLNLDELRYDLPLFLQFFDVLPFKIGNAYALRLTFFIRFFKLAVPGQSVPCRLMDIEEVYVIHTQTFKSFFDS